MSELKTTTVGYEDNPSYSYCMGHVDGKAFEKANQAAGWSKGDAQTVDNDHPQSLFYHGYVKETDTGAEFSRKPKRGYVAGTIQQW